MIKNEAEIRIALQAVLVTVLALTGYWGCAMVVMLIMLPGSLYLPWMLPRTTAGGLAAAKSPGSPREGMGQIERN